MKFFSQQYTSKEPPCSDLTLLIGCQEEHLACKKGAMRWLSVWNKVQMMCIWSSWCHCHLIISCFIKIQIRFTFLVPAYPGCPGKEAIKQVSFCLKSTDGFTSGLGGLGRDSMTRWAVCPVHPATWPSSQHQLPADCDEGSDLWPGTRPSPQCRSMHRNRLWSAEHLTYTNNTYIHCQLHWQFSLPLHTCIHSNLYSAKIIQVAQLPQRDRTSP